MDLIIIDLKETDNTKEIIKYFEDIINHMKSNISLILKPRIFMDLTTYHNCIKYYFIYDKTEFKIHFDDVKTIKFSYDKVTYVLWLNKRERFTNRINNQYPRRISTNLIKKMMKQSSIEDRYIWSGNTKIILKINNIEIFSFFQTVFIERDKSFIDNFYTFKNNL